MTDKPIIWILLGPRKGDNDQLRALAGRLSGLVVEKQLKAHPFWRLVPPRWMGASLRRLLPLSRAEMRAPWPDLVLVIGRRFVPVARWIQEQSGGWTRIVALGRPCAPAEWFDLVVSTPQYGLRSAPNLISLPLALSKTVPGREDGADRAHLLLVGGPSWPWVLDAKALLAGAESLSERSRSEGGRLWVAFSRRTPASIRKALMSHIRATGTPADIVGEQGARLSFADAMAQAETISVTADSVSMISQAVMTGRPVGIVPVRRALWGHLWTAGADALRALGLAKPRDLRLFWDNLARLGIGGTVEAPRATHMPPLLDEVADRIDRMLDLRVFLKQNSGAGEKEEKLDRVS